MRMCASLIQSRWNLNRCAMDCKRSHWKTQLECLAYLISQLLWVSHQPGGTQWVILFQSTTANRALYVVAVAKLPKCYYIYLWNVSSMMITSVDYICKVKTVIYENFIHAKTSSNRIHSTLYIICRVVK